MTEGVTPVLQLGSAVGLLTIPTNPVKYWLSTERGCLCLCLGPSDSLFSPALKVNFSLIYLSIHMHPGY